MQDITNIFSKYSVGCGPGLLQLTFIAFVGELHNLLLLEPGLAYG